MSDVGLIFVDLPDGSLAASSLASHYVGAVTALAVVDASTWGQVHDAGERNAQAFAGLPIPGAGHLRTWAVLDDPDLLPASHFGAPPGHDGSMVRWWTPPHPLAFDPELCTTGLVNAKDAKRGTNSMVAALDHADAPAFINRLTVAMNVADAAWRTGAHIHACQVLHYCKGEHIAWHRDTDIHQIGVGWHHGFKVSAIVQLSDPGDYTGGEVEFEIDGRTFTLPADKGTVAVFRSDVLHRVRPVTSGDRWSATAFAKPPD